MEYRTKRYDYAIWLTKHYRDHDAGFIPRTESIREDSGRHTYWFFPDYEECEAVIRHMPPYLAAIINAVKVIKRI